MTTGDSVRSYVRFRAWWHDLWHLDRYRCGACGWTVTMTRARLRSLGIDPDTMYHSHARLITTDTSAILNTFIESNAERRMVLVGTESKGNKPT